MPTLNDIHYLDGIKHPESSCFEVRGLDGVRIEDVVWADRDAGELGVYQRGPDRLVIMKNGSPDLEVRRVPFTFRCLVDQSKERLAFISIAAAHRRGP